MTIDRKKIYGWGDMLARGWSRRLAARYLGTDPDIPHRRLHSCTWDAALIDAVESRIGPELAAVRAKRDELHGQDQRNALVGTIVDRIKGFGDERRARLMATYDARHGLTDEERRAIEAGI